MMSVNFGNKNPIGSTEKLGTNIGQQMKLLTESVQVGEATRKPFVLPQYMEPITWKPHGPTITLPGGKTQTREISSDGRLKTTTISNNGATKTVEDLGKINRITVKNPQGKTVSDTTSRKSEEELQKSLHLIG